MIERGFDWIKDLKKQMGKKIPDLLALTRQHDPFYVGSPTDRKEAEWFAAMWRQEYEGQNGIHIRRVHYHLVAEGKKFPKLNGMPYTNTKADWCLLLKWSRAARLLDLVPADAFEDRRNEAPYSLNWRMADVRSPSFTVPDSQSSWWLPSLRLNLSSSDWKIETPRVYGYDPDDYLDRAYYLEVWIEKSTMDDILIPLTRELGIRLVTSSGFQSISNAVKLLKRVREIGKPARIFYISDFDKAGRGMPIAVSRQIEFWLPKFAPGADVKLSALALTAAQIAEHHLPYSVDKKHSVELDALEALVPGELERIVREAVEPYLDESVDGRLTAAGRRAQKILREKWSLLMGTHERRLEALQKRVRSVAQKYQKEADVLNKRLERDLEPFKEPLARLQVDMADSARTFSPTLPGRPAQTANEQDELDYLFDSSRPYLEQLRFYKAQRKG